MKSRWPYLWGLALILVLAGGKFAYDYFYFDIEKRPTLIDKPVGPVTPLEREIELPKEVTPPPTAAEVQRALATLGIPAGEVDGK